MECGDLREQFNIDSGAACLAQFNSHVNAWNQSLYDWHFKYGRTDNFSSVSHVVFPDSDPEVAQFGGQTLDTVFERIKGGETFRAVATDMALSFSAEQFSLLPTNLRRDMLLSIVSPDNTEEQKARLALIMGGPFEDGFDVNRLLGLPPEYMRWRLEMDQQLEAQRLEDLQGNPALYDTYTKWGQDSSLVTDAEKMELAQFWAEKHAEHYGLRYVPEVVLDEHTSGKMSTTIQSPLITVNPDTGLPLERDMFLAGIDHEGTHLIQFDWLRSMDEIQPGDPRFAAVRMFADSTVSTNAFSGTAFQGKMAYMLSAHELDAFFIESPEFINGFDRDEYFERPDVQSDTPQRETGGHDSLAGQTNTMADPSMMFRSR